MHRGVNCLFVFIFCFIQSFVSIGQSLPVAMDSVGGVWDTQTMLTEMFDSNTVRALSESGILKDYSAQVFDEYSALFKSDAKSQLDSVKRKLNIPWPEMYGSIDSKFVKNRAGDNEEWINLSFLKFGAAANVLNMPLDVSFQGAFLNNEFNWNLSGLNVSFDQRAFLENLAQEKISKIKSDLPSNPLDVVRQTDIKKIFSERKPNPEIPNNPFDNKSVDVLRNELKFKVLTFVTSHPKYQEILSKGVAKKDSMATKVKRKFKIKNDSLTTQYDSLKTTVLTQKESLQKKYEGNKKKANDIIETAKNTDRKKLKKKAKEELSSTEVYTALQKISTKYKSSWEERKKYYGDSLQVVKQKFLAGTIKGDVKDVGKDSLMSIINSAKDLTAAQKVLQHLNKLNIGRTVIDDHWFLAENLSLNGALLDYESGSYNIAAAVGVQRFDYSILPLLGFSIPTRLPDKKFLYGSVVYKMDDLFELKFSTLNSKEKFNEFSTGIPLERNNNVFLVSGKTKIVQGLKLVTDLAYSRTNGLVIQIPELDEEKNINNAAGEIKLEYVIPKTSFSVEAGYFFIGPQYLTLGNPFIRADQKGLTFGFSGSLFNRINLDVTARQGRSVASTNANPGRSDLSINGSVNVNLTKNLSFTAAVYPNFTNYQYSQLFNVKSNLWSTSYDLQHAFQGDKIKSIQNITYSNSINEFILQDSTGTNNYDGLIYFGNVIFNNGLGFDVLAMGWSDQGLFSNGINQSNIQLSGLLQKDKFSFRLGFLIGEEVEKKIENSSELTYGVAVGANMLFFEKINLGLDARLPLGANQDTETPQLLQEYISTKLSFKF